MCFREQGGKRERGPWEGNGVTADPDDDAAPYLVRFVPADGRPPVGLARAWTHKAGWRELNGHAARLMAEGERGVVELVDDSRAVPWEIVLRREAF